MDEEVCQYFKIIWDDFPDTLSDGNYNFNCDHICKTYCGRNWTDYCESDTDKIMTGFVSLFMKLYESNLINEDAPNRMNIVEYLIIWLIYMLKLKDGSTISNLSEAFYSYIHDSGGHILASTDTDYSKIIEKLIVNKNYLVNMDKNILSKFYNALKLLCSMYNDINSDTSDCTKYFTKSKEFSDKYQNLLNNNINNEDSSYSQILSTLSTDYDNFKKYCDKKCTGCSSIPSLPTEKTAHLSTPSRVQDSSDSSLQGFEVTLSSSSIATKLIPALLICSIPLFLGIAYKYSLFGFDKRLHRQYLREKVKKIKKKMNDYI
ncbi:Plasmodium variant antigen protein Cir/Yir/Bir, putative [Plasmodium chabaudi adami]|uniref:Plasmodium variant antigen protein Cir/Yir/Bir, putative n=1 Tax=Plasmodium chabaudi adami TaxID=5826 RepID=A0A1D3LC62_PLACE|nr:Plasmodium variant antigen protein Cir/Yir/Bir, putative [Plasmodium chabaudi adami]